MSTYDKRSRVYFITIRLDFVLLFHLASFQHNHSWWWQPRSRREVKTDVNCSILLAQETTLNKAVFSDISVKLFRSKLSQSRDDFRDVTKFFKRKVVRSFSSCFVKLTPWTSRCKFLAFPKMMTHKLQQFLFVILYTFFHVLDSWISSYPISAVLSW